MTVSKNETDEQFSRSEKLLGSQGIERLRRAKIAVFGIGGVGGFACEALARAGVGGFLLVDNDTVSRSNLNRQIIALRSTLGEYKTDVMRCRIHDICPETAVEVSHTFLLPENAGEFDFAAFDYIIDAVDTVTAKLEIISRAKSCGVPVISSMGAGNKLGLSPFKVADISKTTVCPLARVMRQQLKKRGINNVKAVYSEEPPLTPDDSKRDCEHGRSVPGSLSFVPSMAGLVLAGEVIRDLAGISDPA